MISGEKLSVTEWNRLHNGKFVGMECNFSAYSLRGNFPGWVEYW